MASENYVNLQFSEEKIRLTILTNICRMLINRGYMSESKYASSDKEKDSKQEKGVRSIIVEHPSGKKQIDNSLFLPFIGTRVDNNTYTIPLDKSYRDQREGKGEGSIEFDGSVVIVKLVPQVVKDVSNSPLLNEFFKNYSKNHSIIVFDGMTDKVYNTLSKKKNTEAFDRDSLMIDIMSHIGAPNKVEFITPEELAHITNPKVAKMLENDPVCRYYNGKKGDIFRIINPSINNCVYVRYRKVIPPKSGVFK
jgi:DNA-directed RNA polymerase subunit H (RpoH/RPB5)